MPSPVCSCITAGFGVKFLRRHRISMPHGLLSPVGHPGYKNDRGERVSSKTGDRSIYAAGPPSAKDGGDLPTMRRHKTCRVKKHSSLRRVRQPSPTVHKKSPPPHPASPRTPRSIRTKNQVERRLGHVASIGFPYAGASSPIVCSQWSAARVASRERAFPFSSEPRFGSGPFLIFKGKRARSSGTSPLRKKNGSDKKGLQIPPGTA